MSEKTSYKKDQPGEILANSFFSDSVANLEAVLAAQSALDRDLEIFQSKVSQKSSRKIVRMMKIIERMNQIELRIQERLDGL